MVDLLYAGSFQKAKNIRLKSLDEIVESCKQILNEGSC